MAAVVHVANANGYIFSDALDNDMVIGPTGTGQRIMIGALSNAPSAIAVSSNVLTVNRRMVMSNATGALTLYSSNACLGVGNSAPTSTVDVTGGLAVSGTATLGRGYQNALPGYTVLPGNQLMQWGTISITMTSGESSLGVSFPVAFSATPYSAQLMLFGGDPMPGNASANVVVYHVSNLSTTTITARVKTQYTGSLTYNLRYLAVGPA
jgi:hypothetical protein